MKQFYTYEQNLPIDETNVLDLQIKQANAINPTLSIIPVDAVKADCELPAIKADEVLIVEFDEAAELTVSKNVKAVKDHRGLMVYHIETKAETEWQKVKLDEAYTLLKPSEPYSKWNGKQWIEDDNLKHDYYASLAEAELTERMQEASDKINLIEHAKRLKVASKKQLDQYDAWVIYRIKLDQVSEQEGYPVNIDYPEMPVY